MKSQQKPSASTNFELLVKNLISLALIRMILFVFLIPLVVKIMIWEGIIMRRQNFILIYCIQIRNIF